MVVEVEVVEKGGVGGSRGSGHAFFIHVACLLVFLFVLCCLLCMMTTSEWVGGSVKWL